MSTPTKTLTKSSHLKILTHSKTSPNSPTSPRSPGSMSETRLKISPSASARIISVSRSPSLRRSPSSPKQKTLIEMARKALNRALKKDKTSPEETLSQSAHQIEQGSPSEIFQTLSGSGTPQKKSPMSRVRSNSEIKQDALARSQSDASITNKTRQRSGISKNGSGYFSLSKSLSKSSSQDIVYFNTTPPSETKKISETLLKTLLTEIPDQIDSKKNLEQNLNAIDEYLMKHGIQANYKEIQERVESTKRKAVEMALELSQTVNQTILSDPCGFYCLLYEAIQSLSEEGAPCSKKYLTTLGDHIAVEFVAEQLKRIKDSLEHSLEEAEEAFKLMWDYTKPQARGIEPSFEEDQEDEFEDFFSAQMRQGCIHTLRKFLDRGDFESDEAYYDRLESLSLTLKLNQEEDLQEDSFAFFVKEGLDEIQGIDEIMDDLLEAHLNAIFIDQGLELVKEQIAKIQQISDQSSFNVKILEKLNERKQYLALSQNTRQQSSVVRPQQARRESEIVHFHSLSTSSVVSPREKNGTIKEQPKKVSPKSPRSLRKVK